MNLTCLSLVGHLNQRILLLFQGQYAWSQRTIPFILKELHQFRRRDISSD